MRNLSKKGLSMSQAQSISNLCNQNALEIQRELDSYNNCSKTITVEGRNYELQEAHPVPGDIFDKLKNKGDLHACQAFLMESIKAKDAEIERIRNTRPDFSHLVKPERPEIPDFEVVDNVEESWGWAQLTDAEYAEYLQSEAMAAHLGQFIHKNGKLSELRKQLPNVPQIEWFAVEDGKNSPVKVTKHHTSAGLMLVHEGIAGEHRKHEQQVNYYKAKVKNLVSVENARIQKENADKSALFLSAEKSAMEDYKTAMDAYQGELTRLTMEFNSNRELAIKEAAALRISVDPRFQHIIDMFISAE